MPREFPRPRIYSSGASRSSTTNQDDRPPSNLSAAPIEESKRAICYVTGTRAEFGLMQSTLAAIRAHPKLSLQLVATGMHLDRSRGQSLDEMQRAGWKADIVVPWNSSSDSPTSTAESMGNAIAGLATAFAMLKPDIVLVTGDRVEAFAAASAAHVGGHLLAHVHGGDRALGLVDDSLRHAITKLAHLHFPATTQSAKRIERMGEDRRRIFCVGSPGLDGIIQTSAPWSEMIGQFPGLGRRAFGLLALHPQTADPRAERLAADMVLDCARSSGIRQWVIIYPNNDPGSQGIAGCWDALTSVHTGNPAGRVSPVMWPCRNLPRPVFLGLLRDSAMLIGNSSSGIIEAASFGTPVLDIGTRQAGRERGENVIHVSLNRTAIGRAIASIWNDGAPVRYSRRNLYGTGKTAGKIAAALANARLKTLTPKLISY